MKTGLYGLWPLAGNYSPTTTTFDMRKLLLCLALIAYGSLHAQWNQNTDENTLVAIGQTSDIYAATAGDGHTYVVFWEEVPEPDYYNLRLQILGAEGQQVLGEDGIVLSPFISMSSFTTVSRITTTDDGKLFVGVTGSGDYNGYVFKMDTQGNHLWPSTGVIIPGAFRITILPLVSGGAVVAWNEDGAGKMQLYDAAGQPVWPSPKAFSDSGVNASPENMFELSESAGDFMMIYHEYGFGVNSTLYAQRFDSDGEGVWEEPLQLSDKATSFVNEYSSFQEGDVVYIGYSAATNLRFDAFLQRINPDGTLPWGLNGSDFDTDEDFYEGHVEIAMEEGSEYIYAISSYNNSSFDKYGEYVQKFDKTTGERVYGDQALALYEPQYDYHVHVSPLYVVEDHPFFLLKIGEDLGVNPVRLEAVVLNPDGSFSDEENIPVATFEAHKSRITMTPPNAAPAVAVFVEDKGEGNRAYAQGIDVFITGLEDHPAIADLKVFPNPTVDRATWTFSGMEGFDGTLEIYDVNGRTMHTVKNRYAVGWNQVEVDMGQWPAGVYFYRLVGTAGAPVSGKLIKR